MLKQERMLNQKVTNVLPPNVRKPETATALLSIESKFPCGTNSITVGFNLKLVTKVLPHSYYCQEAPTRMTINFSRKSNNVNVSKNCHCVKRVSIRSYSGSYFPAFSGIQKTEYGYGHGFRIQSECGKMRTRITPNSDTFCVVCMS